DRAGLPFIIQILAQVLSGQFPAAAQDASQPGKAQRKLLLDAALAAELEADTVAAHLHVPSAQRSQTIGAILPGIGLVADAYPGLVQQQYHRGYHPIPAQPRVPETPIQLAAHPWRASAEG